MTVKSLGHQHISNWRIRRQSFKGLMMQPFRRALPTHIFALRGIYDCHCEIEGEPQSYQLWLTFRDSYPFRQSYRLARILNNHFGISEHDCSLPPRTLSTHAHLYEHLLLELASRYWPGYKASGITIHPPRTSSFWIFVSTELPTQTTVELSHLAYKIVHRVMSSKRLSKKWIQQEIARIQKEQGEHAESAGSKPVCYIKAPEFEPKTHH